MTGGDGKKTHGQSAPAGQQYQDSDILELLPGLVKVSLKFEGDWYTEIDFPRTVTLPCVQEMDLSAFDSAQGGEEVIPPSPIPQAPKGHISYLTIKIFLDGAPLDPSSHLLS